MRYLTIFALLAVTDLHAARITFARTSPPLHKFDAPSNRITLLRLEGTTDECSHVFLRGDLIKLVKETGAVLEDVSFKKGTLDERRAMAPADLYLASESCACRAQKRTEGDSTWYAATCQAEVRLTDGRDGKDLGVVTINGTADDRTDVLDFAAFITAGRNMIGHLVKMIRPFEQQLVFDTDRKVPGEKEAARFIKAKDYAGARDVWEQALTQNPGNAAIHFNLAAVTEALGQIEEARKHYEEAVRLAPAEEKYARFKGYFDQRNQ